MKKIIIPILLAVVFPLVLMQVKPHFPGTVNDIVLSAAIGAGIGIVINTIIFRAKPDKAEEQTAKTEAETEIDQEQKLT